MGKQAKRKAAKDRALSTRAQTMIGLVAGVLGVALSAFALVAAYRTSRKPELEMLKLRDEIMAASPRLVVSYLSVGQDINMFTQILAYPVLVNDVADEDFKPKTALFELGDPEGEDDPDGEARVTFLKIENKGKRDATDVEIVVERMTLSAKVDVSERLGQPGDDYAAKIRAGAGAPEHRTFRFPTTLGTGQSVLVPLFVTRHPYRFDDAGGSWAVISKIAYIPKTVVFTDPLDASRKEEPVRAMRDPVRLDNGIEMRG
jgi:hypothetical protein